VIAVDGDSVEADGLPRSVVESSAEVVLDGCYKLEKTRVGGGASAADSNIDKLVRDGRVPYILSRGR
jgi:hypothetical protein